MILGCRICGAAPSPTSALPEPLTPSRYATMNTRSEPGVRRATSADATALANLRFAFRSSLAVTVESAAQFLARCVPWMERNLADESRWRAWMLVAGATPIGAIWLQIIEKIPNPTAEPELHAYVTNFFVVPNERGRGFGSQLLDTLLAECDTLGVDTIFLWPTAESRGLYRRYGFSTTDSVMVRMS
jgi:ribosomal protein S18 acetylase RimI-like enzyme